MPAAASSILSVQQSVVHGIQGGLTGRRWLSSRAAAAATTEAEAGDGNLSLSCLRCARYEHSPPCCPCPVRQCAAAQPMDVRCGGLSSSPLAVSPYGAVHRALGSGDATAGPLSTCISFSLAAGCDARGVADAVSLRGSSACSVSSAVRALVGPLPRARPERASLRLRSIRQRGHRRHSAGSNCTQPMLSAQQRAASG